MSSKPQDKQYQVIQKRISRARKALAAAQTDSERDKAQEALDYHLEELEKYKAGKRAEIPAGATPPEDLQSSIPSRVRRGKRGKLEISIPGTFAADMLAKRTEELDAWTRATAERKGIKVLCDTHALWGADEETRLAVYRQVYLDYLPAEFCVPALPALIVQNTINVVQTQMAKDKPVDAACAKCGHKLEADMQECPECRTPVIVLNSIEDIDKLKELVKK